MVFLALTRWRRHACGGLLYVLVLLASAAAQDPNPPLHVGEITVIVTDLYGRQDLDESGGLINFAYRTMNALHPATKGHVIRRELLMASGDPYDPELLAETERNLRSLGFLTNVSVAAVDTAGDGSVPVEVRVQETWSLSTHLSYSRSSASDRWTVLLSDRNFMGYGVKLEAGLGQDEDRDWQHLGFYHRRLFGRSLEWSGATIDLSDGYTHRMSLGRPFYAQDDRWNWTVQAWDNVFAPRYYLSRGPEAPADGAMRIYASPTMHREGLTAMGNVRLSPVGQGRLWRLGIGITTERLSFADRDTIPVSGMTDFTPAEFRDAAGLAMLRESGRTARAFLTLETLGRHWTTDRYVLRYGVEEDFLLDPYLWLRAGPALADLGSDHERMIIEAAGQDWSRFAGGWLMTSFSGQGAVGGPRDRWHLLDLSSGWHRKGLGGLNRVWVEGAVARDVIGTMVPVLGLSRGLRTLEYDGMAGDRLVRWNLEHAHLVSNELFGFYHLAVAAFYAGGVAWWSDEPDERRVERQELGVGLRFGPSRSSRAEVSRLDLAWPLDGSSGPQLTAATGGHF